MIEKEFPTDIAPFIPRWVALLIMPIGFASIAFHMIYNSYSKLKNRVILVALIILIILLFQWEVLRDINLLPYILIAAILFSLYKGAPIFIGLGGLALLFFWRDWTPISAISAETYRIVVSPTLPTIPLFTLAGYMLAESKASERLVLLFRALFGWIPGCLLYTSDAADE